LSDRGINAMPVTYRAVEESAARLRFFITSNHTEQQVRDAVAAVREELARLAPSRSIAGGVQAAV
jgi:7-keto-8-aminopelargonate synthetase-like enzyme